MLTTRLENRQLAVEVLAVAVDRRIVFDEAPARIIIDQIIHTDGAQVSGNAGYATIDSYAGDGIVVSGYGRPFEAAAGLEVWRGAVLIDAEWRQVDRTGSGSSFAYSTTDWLEAWGRWSVGG